MAGSPSSHPSSDSAPECMGRNGDVNAGTEVMNQCPFNASSRMRGILFKVTFTDHFTDCAAPTPTL